MDNLFGSCQRSASRIREMFLSGEASGRMVKDDPEMSINELSPTMREAIDHAIKHSGGDRAKCVLVRFPGGFWGSREWSYGELWFGTSTIEGIVKRGAGEYTRYQPSKKGGKFPIEVKINAMKGQ